ncbi:hypothetical protein IFM89_016581 [Coptis chinensis]|uniref:DUF4408 domain-containing protein n=1 Tax=Coptis chinensis TaxID=261450 RepID=A0A835I0K2_9MAGN|nr:hypothetical protein IFM89_016581 [Coptis chinensis]
MDFSFDNVKAEKAHAMKRYHRLRKIASLFRLLEIFIVLFLFSWFSTQLPSVIQIITKYFKKFCVLLISPRFVFLIGNAIIITLFVKSGQFSSNTSSSSNEETSLYEEFVKNSENCQKIVTTTTTTEEVVFQDKETVCEEKKKCPGMPRDTNIISPPHSPRDAQKKKPYRRSQSENVKREISDKVPGKELRRSETEKCQREVKISGEDFGKISDGEKEMSNEELQRRFEAFIAKQMKFHWEESMAIVVQNQS